MISDEAVQAAVDAVRNSMLAHDYTASPSDFRTDIASALEAAGPLMTDPIETGREAALAQWHERWRQALDTSTRALLSPSTLHEIADRIPVGKGPDLPHSEVMRRTAELLGFEPDNHHNALRCPYCCPPDRVTFQLEPERAKRLLEVLRSAGAHPSGLGSYEAANDANALADDIQLMVDR